MFFLLAPLFASAGDPLPDDVWFFRQPEVLVPRSGATFVIDGEVASVERSGATELSQFLTYERAASGDDKTTVWLAHNGEQLYVGFQVRLPAGQEPRVTAQGRDDRGLWSNDDAIEIRFLVGDTLYGFIGNAAGHRGDLIYSPRDNNWRSDDWHYAARTTADGWEGEFLFDAAVFGLDRLESGSEWRADVFHNYKSGTASGLAYQAGRWNANQDIWPRLVFADAGAVFQAKQEIGIIDNEDIGLDAVLRNPAGASRQVDVWARLYRVRDEKEPFSYFEQLSGIFDRTGVDILPGASDEELLEWALKGSLLPNLTPGDGLAERWEIPAGGEKRLRIRRPTFPGSYLVAYRFADRDGGSIASGVFPFYARPALTTEIEYHYLTAAEVEARTEVPDAPGIRTIRYTVRKDAEPVGVTEVHDVTPGGVAVAALPSDGWPPGELRLVVEALDGSGAVLSDHEMNLEKPEAPPSWWQSDAGNRIEVSWPWTPVEASIESARVWGREYSFGRTAFPFQIVSQGEELLSAPIRLHARHSGDDDSRWTAPGVELVEASAGKAVYRSDLSFGGLQARVVTTVEFDGMMRFDLAFQDTRAAGGGKVEELFFEVPMRREHAELFARSRALGLQPEEDVPSEWHARHPMGGHIEEEAIVFPFTPTVTLRSDEAGIEWFAEQDWVWSNRDANGKIEVLPRGDEVVLRIRLVDRPTAFEEPRRITFGLQVWPVKPWPERQANISNYLGRFRHGPNPEVNMGDTLEEVRANLRRAMELGLNVMWIFHWASYTAPDGTRVVSIPDYPQFINDTVRERVAMYAAATQAEGLPVIGHAGYAMPTYVPDWEFYGMEMVRRPISHRGVYGYKFCASSPFTDGFVTRYKEIAEEMGWSGTQLDEALYPQFCDSVRHGCGRRDESGAVRGSFPIFAYRDLARRLYNVFHGEVDFPGIERGFVYNHIGRSTLSVIDAFADTSHSGEEPVTMNVRTLAEIDLDRERAVYPVDAMGVPRDWLLKLGRAPVGTRGRIAMALQLNMNLQHNRILQHASRSDYDKNSITVHRVWAARDWIFSGDAKFYGYWKNGDMVSVEGDDFYAAVYLDRGKRLLLAVSNWVNEPRATSATLNLPAMGFDSSVEWQVEDAITGEKLPFERATLPLEVTADGYRLIKLWPAYGEAVTERTENTEQ